MKVLLLTGEEFPTRRPMLAELWNEEFTARGHTIRWVMTSKEMAEPFRVQSWGRNTVILYPSPVRRFTPAGSVRYLRTVWRLIALMKEHRSSGTEEHLHVHNDLVLGLISAFLRKWTGRRYSVALTFPFSQLYRTRGGIIARSFAWAYDRLLGIVVRNASLICPISRGYQDLLSSQFNVPTERFLPVSESASAAFLRVPAVHTRSRTFLYIGEISALRRLEVIIDAFNRVHSRYADAQLLLVGWGLSRNDVPSLKEYASRTAAAPAIRFRDPVPHHEIPAIITSVAAGISAVPPLELYRVSTPTKCIEYLSLGVPVIANREIPDQHDILSASGGGLETDFTAESFAEAMLRILDDPEAALRMGTAGRSWIAEHRTFARTAAALDERISTLYRR